MRSAVIPIIFCVAIFPCSPANETEPHRSTGSRANEAVPYRSSKSPSSEVGSAPSECGGGKLYRVAPGGAVVAPALLKRVHPDRPDDPVPDPYSIGVVIMETIITKDGQVCAPTVWRGTGTSFDQQALAATKQWQFTPAQLNGQPVNCIMLLTVPIPKHGA